MTVVRLSPESFTTIGKTEWPVCVGGYAVAFYNLAHSGKSDEKELWSEKYTYWSKDRAVFVLSTSAPFCVTWCAHNNWAVALHVWQTVWNEAFHFAEGHFLSALSKGVDKRSYLSASFAQQDIFSTKENDIQNSVSFKRKKKENQSELKPQSCAVSMTTETMQQMCPQKNLTSYSRYRRIA